MRELTRNRFTSNSSFIRHDIQPTVSICGEGEGCLNIVGGQIREIIRVPGLTVEDWTKAED